MLMTAVPERGELESCSKGSAAQAASQHRRLCMCLTDFYFFCPVLLAWTCLRGSIDTMLATLALQSLCRGRAASAAPSQLGREAPAPRASVRLVFRLPHACLDQQEPAVSAEDTLPSGSQGCVQTGPWTCAWAWSSAVPASQNSLCSAAIAMGLGIILFCFGGMGCVPPWCYHDRCLITQGYCRTGLAQMSEALCHQHHQ